ncbi:RDD family protein [Streptomyces sp. SID13031]|uniref:RDD family protein n=1 Tax=Streptomyces sp. SID13031 TaxID=2706046 RepID=UPI0013CD5A45|nr:RDD family protein [Streptomyces sp. SID13031]NEA36006.1 RDD family protein [Streptomyces sp. SID13031]
MLTARRGLATAIDYAAMAAPLGLLAALTALRYRRRPLPQPSATKVRVLVAVGLTMPLSAVLAATEAAGGSPGKRAMGLTLRDDTNAEPPSYSQALTRSLLKTALPWELGHQAVWEFRADNTRRGTVLAAGAYLALGLQAAAIVRGRRTYPDHVARTRVTSA